MQNVQDDDVVMGLVGEALSRPLEEREAYVRRACDGDTDLFDQVWGYVDFEARMSGFMAHPALEYFLQSLPGPAFSERLFRPGERVAERFRIVREIAEGGMGVVYEAVDERLHRRVAIKCAKTGFGNRLPPEVRHASEISHPNVCKIFDIHTASTAQGDAEFFSMEFLHGETLAARLRAGPLPESEARSIAKQLCAGLAEAHRNRVVHGDLKTNNVILTAAPDGSLRAVITDFGLSRGPAIPVEVHSLGQLMQSAPVGGAPAYMAPELRQGGKPTTVSDVYALGVILSELASGKRPGASVEDRSSPKPLALQTKWNGAVTRCLDPDPAKRFEDAGKVAQALAPRSRRWIVGAIAAVLLATVSGALTYQRATAPKETVRLVLLPFESSNATQSAAELSRDTAVQLAHLKGNSQKKFVFIPEREVTHRNVDSAEKSRTLLSATHVLRGTLETEGGIDVIHVYLTDARSGVNTNEWDIRYEPPQLRYAPVAITGLVTMSLAIPPLVTKGEVNAAARQDYLTGLSYVNGDVRPDDAVTLLERAVNADPDSPLTYAGLAEAQWNKYSLTNLEKTRESVRQAELRNPDVPEVLLISGWLKKNSNRPRQAENDLRRVIALQPDNGDAYRRLGKTLDGAGQPGEALAAFQKAVEVRPRDIDNYRALGSFYNARSRYEEALREFKTVVELSPDRADSHYLLGSAFFQLNRNPEAERELRESIRLGDSAFAEQLLAFLLCNTGKADEAINHYKVAINFPAQTSYLWLGLGICYSVAKRETEARSAFEKGSTLAKDAVKDNPDDKRERANLAYFEARLGNSQGAVFELEQALKGPIDDDTRQMAIFTYEAIRDREHALDLVRESPKVLRQLTWFPELEKLRQDPRFKALLKSQHLE